MKYLSLFVSLCLLTTIRLYGEGVKELAPNGSITVNGNATTDVAALYLNHDEYNDFGAYNSPNPNSRLYVHIEDPTAECILLGFSAGHANATSTNPPLNTFEYRIKDPAGNIIFGPVTVAPADANINSWQEGFTGPLQLFGGSGYDAVEVSSADLMSGGWNFKGDYYIEFRNVDSATPFLIDFWDITVTNCGNLPNSQIKGRVWSYNWALFAINDYGFPNRPFNGSFYVCAPDPDNAEAAYVTRINFNNGGFRPAAFNIAFNSYGSMNTGNISEDRKSVENINATQSEYQIFLNDPEDVCQTAEVGTIVIQGLTRCDLQNICIEVIASKAGQLEVILDLDGQDDIYTPGTADLMISVDISENEVGVPTCINWNGLDGLGNPVLEEFTSEIPVIIAYAQGIFNFPIYDAEYLTSGFVIEAIRPPGPFPLLYYDDSNISVSSGSGEPAVQLTGCNIPCHAWTNYTDPNLPGFGNLNTINSWWYSQLNSQKNIFVLPLLLTCDISGPESFCDGTTSFLDLNTTSLPEGIDPAVIVSSVWSGPGIIGVNTGESIEIDQPGVYEVQVEWEGSTGEICTSQCSYFVSQLENSEGFFDTLIISGTSIDINGENYDEAGTFEQLLESSNGCDSLLTIYIEIIQSVVHYNLDDCDAYPVNETNMDYSEFTATYPEPLSCAEISADILQRVNPAVNMHSCTPGVDDSPAMCVGSLDSCNYVPGSEKALIFSVTITPDQDTAVALTGLSFFERGPEMFDWIDGADGPNNYPTLFGVRVLKDGNEIYRDEAIPTNLDWTEHSFSFLGEADFIVDASSVFQFELLPYCLAGNGAVVDAWDIDELNVQASCTSISNITGPVTGKVFSRNQSPMQDVYVQISEDQNFGFPITDLTDTEGNYTFETMQYGKDYYLKAIKNNDFKNGVSTLDIVMIQRHLLGIEVFDHPYDFIAADINNSKTVTALDILLLRQLILGKIESFPENTSWRFALPSEEVTVENPWDIPETLELYNYNSNHQIPQFTGIKIGDINNSSIADLNSDAETRNIGSLQILYSDQYVHAGEIVTVDLYSASEIKLFGMQLGIEIEQGKILEIKPQPLAKALEYHITQNKGNIFMSWVEASGTPLLIDNKLFTLMFKAEKEGYVHEFIKINKHFKNEVYVNPGLEIQDIKLLSREEDMPSSHFEWKIQPNPALENVQILLQTDDKNSVWMTVTNSFGAVQYREYIPLKKGENVFTVPLDSFSDTGILFIQVEGPSIHETKKLIRLH